MAYRQDNTDLYVFFSQVGDSYWSLRCLSCRDCHARKQIRESDAGRPCGVACTRRSRLCSTEVTHWAHDVVATLNQRHYDVDSTSRAQWEE